MFYTPETYIVMMNPNNPQTPGVYTVEKNAFPPSVAQVPTAIPAFIGYTEKAEDNGKSLIQKPKLVNSLAEYNHYFGGSPDYQFPIREVPKGPPAPKPDEYDFYLNGKYYKVEAAAKGLFYLYNSLRMFYLNGGGPAYIVSVGTYFETSIDPTTLVPDKTFAAADRDALLDGLSQLPLIQFPKPTMILMPDALALDDKEDCYVIQQQMIAQAGELKDRVAMLDIYDGWKGPDNSTVIPDFRNNMGVSFLNYAIAYYPWLECAVVDASEVTYANVYAPTTAEQNANKWVNIKDVLVGVALLGKLDTINKDMMALETNLMITSKIKLGTANAMVFSQWSTAFNGSAANAPGDILKDQGTVLAAMYQVIYDLGTKGSTTTGQAFSITSKDLISAISLMVTKNGTLASTMALVGAYEKNFPNSTSGGNAGTAISSKLSTWGGISPNSTNPYPTYPTGATDLVKGEIAFNMAMPIYKNAFNQLFNALNKILAASVTILDQYNTALENSNKNYKNIMSAVAKQANILPPTGAMAGVYTLVDNTEGVWYAPANRNIDAVVAPMVPINDDQQAPLNVDALAGKSINVIRSFYGRGPAMIWGARTMAGNSLDWKYINVRRLMIMIEQSVANAAFSLVFEPNDASTWTTCESMINNFLHNLWSEGALQGSTPAAAYNVMVGLGKTMTPLDILEGIMRVQVQVAPVRPAEFIIITYEQEMPKA